VFQKKQAVLIIAQEIQLDVAETKPIERHFSLPLDL